jgi:cysteine-rich repeat protein
VQAGVEQCDDGNLVNGDGCNATCKLDKIYLAGAEGQTGFYAYTILTNTWEKLADPPASMWSQITNDGKVVFLIGKNNVIYEYTPAQNLWTASATPGPGNFVGIGYFKWTSQGFYAWGAGNAALYHYKNNAWQKLNWMPTSISAAGSWDRTKNELYVRSYGELGFKVLDTTTDTIVRTIADPTYVQEESLAGSLSGAYFYSRTFGGTLQRLNAMTGDKINTGAKPTCDNVGSDVDVASGQIYLAPCNTFQRFNPGNNTLTTLAPGPQIFPATITVMLPPA